MLERRLKNSIIREIKKLRAKGIPVWYMKTEGKPPGIPDIILCLDGKFIGIELKADNGRIRECQNVQMELIKKAGGICKIVQSVEEFKQLLGTVTDGKI